MIAIKMEMPDTCSDCDLCHGHICKKTGTDIVANPKGGCPLVEDAVERSKIDKAIEEMGNIELLALYTRGDIRQMCIDILKRNIEE